MAEDKIAEMRKARKVLLEFPFEIKELHRGYSDRTLRIDLDKNEITILPVTQQMKDLWTGGKGFDLWLMFQEIDKNTKWDSPNNPICFSPGPLGGTTSFPGSGKTLVTSISPMTSSIMDCNVGGFFGPFLKFAGFDALVLVGKCKDETILVIDAVKKKITIEHAPAESIDSHVVAEELTEMYADDDLDKRNIAVVSAGRAADHARMGILNFSFWDWRRNFARLKQAGRGGIGRVFRDKKLKALVIKNRDISPAWRIEENKVAHLVKPKKMVTQCGEDIEIIDGFIEKWGNDPEFITEMMQDIQERFNLVSVSAIDRLQRKTGVPKAYLYHIATFDPYFSLEPETPAEKAAAEPITSLFSKGDPLLLRSTQAEDFNGLKKAVELKQGEAVIEEIKKSGLKGRNCGVSIGDKWQAVRDAALEADAVPYVICSAGAANPYAVVGRTLLEMHPQMIIEGMVTAAFAVGAKEGIVVINREHTLAEERLNKALETARGKGCLGKGIQGTDFDFDIRVHRSGGNSVFGEATSLVTALAGKAGESQSPYIPLTEKGFNGKPTLLSNAETYANIGPILENGPKWFAGSGTNDTSGTTVLYLGGAVNTPSLVEVPMGTTLKEIVDSFGGGVGNNGNVKAVQVGGPLGGYIPADKLDTPMDFSSLEEAGAAFGNGMLTVIADDACMIGEALENVEFLAGQSCGKCTPCREGLYAVKNILTRMAGGKGKPEDPALLEELSNTISSVSLCGFGAKAPKSLLSALKYFQPEFKEHAEGKQCKA